MRHGGISTSERNKKLQRLFGDEDPYIRKLKFGVVDTQKHQLNLHDTIPFVTVADPTQTQLVCFVNTTARDVVEELTALRKKDDATRHSFAVAVFEDSDGFVTMERPPTINRV
ncbi:uncharacterized protein LOC34622926 [Cyclospora cayetanensis]|uniref:Uncharacterized protein LOC34622926 n=1 Tax=Cyclospora cayetanensis TaxID=88456 RepID=A0A6P6RYP2_9EIME|nr:uncharacterized protein LOC34622926 [Cyclospora cayetanensis]